jgi:putative PIN family toxin of toxin-antitoxin system
VRVALDTNVLVSAVATRGLCADLLNLVLAEHELVVGETVLTELGKILRERIRVPGRIIDEYVALLRQEGSVVEAATPLDVKIRDKSDLPVLSEAVAGMAEVLVTGDRDLLEVSAEIPLEILTPRGLWTRLREGAPPPRGAA